MSTQITLQNILALSPIIATSFTAVFVMLAIAAKRNHFWNATVAVAGLNVALLALWWVYRNVAMQQVTGLFVVDGYACFYMAIILVAALASLTLTYGYMEKHSGNREEIYLLLLLSTVGALVLACSNHMASLFIGMEILSVPLFGLAAYSFQRSRSLEAGIKYLVLSATSTAFLLFGMALLYAQTGSLSFAGVQASLAGLSVMPPLAWIACAMVFVALAFKLSLVPFHLWTPDVYEGSPAPVTAFLATVSKTTVLVAFFRLLHSMPVMNTGPMHDLMMVIAGLSIIVGNWLALTQTNVKRLLAYSSIAHFGYLMIAVVAGSRVRDPAIAVYLVTYVITSLAAFGVLVLASSPYQGTDADSLHHFRGLFWKRPYLAAVMTVAMLSLAGIPMTAGFIGKFHVVVVGVTASFWWLLGVLVIGSAMGLYYYLRVMVTLYLVEPGVRRFNAPLDWGRTTGGAMLLLIALLMLLVGIYPQPLMQAVLAATMM